MDERLADMDGRLRGSAVDDAGGMRTRISNLESEIRALRSRQEDFEQESKGKTAQLSQATGDLTTSQATLNNFRSPTIFHALDDGMPNANTTTQ